MDSFEDLSAATDMAAPITATFAAQVSQSDSVSFFYSQGVARFQNGWIFSASGRLWRTDDKFNELAEVNGVPLPAELTALGFNHIGDIDVAEGVIYGAMEQHDFGRNQQVVIRFDPMTLKYIDHVLLPQHEAPWVTVEDATMTAFLTDRYSDDTLLRYDIKGGWKKLPSLKLSQKLEHIQGADIAQGAIWLSCDDPPQGIYRADLQTGVVQQIGTVNRQTKIGDFRPEVEGIDATPLPSGLLHVLTGEPLQATSWLDHFAVNGAK